ncbi:M48 family metalloprotease [Burkholderiaceae bacterium FT117]|uniref:M48 family metalloprotease n=1 Tax=Zeimonas sediminis TaxID=2944268 RepID=UPI002342ECB0|nr:M48 family metalloprotease [Zeimonas sediminis]MCM5570984.1 M48 family metalloprotease [Zeimonas sediminis]
MDFFAHQDRARTLSARLVLLFGLAIVAVVVAVNLAALATWRLLFAGAGAPPYFVATNAFVVLLIVGGSAWLERHRLGDSGDVLAERLGARLLDDANPQHRRLRDVAEEVAVGAGVPVPALYVIDDPAINALAAGERPAIAAIMLTRGALERLDRAQLQGVVAHEFAHILGGDAARNVRLTAALYGLYSLRIAGGHLLESALQRGAGRAGPLSLLSPLAGAAGLVVSALGLLGVFAGQLLRAGISRQREFLADAVAVQLTRDRDGLGSALRRIAAEHSMTGAAAGPGHGGYEALVSHFLLVQPAGAGDWFDSHPPLAERIRRLYGRPMPPLRDRAIGVQPALEVSRAPAIPGESLGARLVSRLHLPARLAPRAGAFAGLPAPGGDESRTDVLRWAETMAIAADDRPAAVPLSATPAAALIERMRAPALNREDASRWLCALVAGHAEGGAGEEGDPRVAAALRWLLSPAGAALRVPVLELMLARIRRWSSTHRREMLDRCRRTIERDGRVDSAEWVHYTLARHRLLPQAPGGARNSVLRAAGGRAAHGRALAALFAMAAAIGEASARTTRDTLAETAALLGVPPPAATPDELDTVELAHALDTLVTLPPLDKPLLLKMLAKMARTPGNPDFDAFVRAVAAAIDCPVPRLALPTSPA